MSVATSVPVPDGLSVVEAAPRLHHRRPQPAAGAAGTPAWRLLLAQLTHFFAGMLWLAILALVAGMASLCLAIVVIVLLNGVFAFVQEHKADQAAAPAWE